MGNGNGENDNQDCCLLIHIWNRLNSEAFPRIEVDWKPGELAKIQRAGMSLQRLIVDAVTQHSPLPDGSEDLDFLMGIAHGDTTHPLTDELYRIAAVYHLWPYYAACYYREVQDRDERLKAREQLCFIQRLLYSNIRPALSFLCTAFNVYKDTSIRDYLVGEYRSLWRPEELTKHSPDLCAIDYLGVHMLEVEEAGRLVSEAVKEIHSLALGETQVYQDKRSKCLEVLQKFQVAQMTLFYYPDPISVPEQSDLPLIELVYDASKRGDDTPDLLIPFHRRAGDDWEPDTGKNSFRFLASKIYSSTDVDGYEKFAVTRRATLDQISANASFISDGAVTFQFPDENGLFPWPVWYAKSLEQIDLGGAVMDWGHESWWEKVDEDKVQRALFPGVADVDNYHGNHHIAAFWDFYFKFKQEPLDINSWVKQGTSLQSQKTTYSHLLELLLRRDETETRTSFFLALAHTQTVSPYLESPDNQGTRGLGPRLTGFVGGTFLGLERPGVPFEEERFRAISRRLRPLLLSLAHYTTARLIREKRLEKAAARREYYSRVQSIVDLMAGEVGMFGSRNGQLLYATNFSGDEFSDDHDEKHPAPSREQIKAVFSPHWSYQSISKENRLHLDCDDTWKALLYLPEESSCRTLQQFLEIKDIQHQSFSQRQVVCIECLRNAMSYLLDKSMLEGHQLQVDRNEGLYLPSRPGIRFLMSLCGFLHDVQSGVSADPLLPTSRVKKLTIKAGCTEIEFDTGTLCNLLREWTNPIRTEPIRKQGSHLEAAFWRLIECKPFDDRNLAPGWAKFLCYEKFACKLMYNISDQSLILKWPDLWK
jgi:hypothetical protein